MATDPYQDMSREELEATGATSWLSDDLAQQQRRDAKLRSSLGQDTGAIRAGKQKLKGMLGDLPPDLEPEEPVLDIFAAERAAAQKKSSSLSSLLGDLQESQAADQSLLRDLFGK